MPVASDEQFRGTGTRVALFPQSPDAGVFSEPETVWLAPSAGSVAPGPADEYMYVVDPLDKHRPYDYPYHLPPYVGAAHPPAAPGPDGHFDHIDPTSHEFQAAHMYGCARRVLDIWEGYFGRRIEWHFREHYPRLELIPFLDWDNAQAGYGFVETGYGGHRHEASLHCLNFDVVAHEIGHLLLFSEIGIPLEEKRSPEFYGFNESTGDLIALVAVLHFDSVVDHLLATTGGNLYTHNVLNRLGEVSRTEQIRVAANDCKMSDLTRGWRNEHELSLPLTGAIFDVFVDVFQDGLLEQGLIDTGLMEKLAALPDPLLDDPGVQSQLTQAYEGQHEAFKAALLEARDYLGFCLASAWARLEADTISYTGTCEALRAADREVSGGRYEEWIASAFKWREIGEIEPINNGFVNAWRFPPSMPFRKKMRLGFNSN